MPSNAPNDQSPAVFLDRDGTIMRDVEYCGDPARVELFSGVAQALRGLKAAGFRIVIITNQSGIGRGYFNEQDYRAVEEEVERQIGAGVIDATYFCPDHPDNGSTRRKPEPGMILEAQREHGLGSGPLFHGGRQGARYRMRTARGRSHNSGSHRHRAVSRARAVPTGKRATWRKRPRSFFAMQTKAVGIIPARWGSTRFPGKPLHLIAGKPLLWHVWERSRRARKLDSVIIATDDMRIAEAAFDWGAEVAMTSARHRSGTDRIAAVVAKAPEFTHIVNIQGDEPLIAPRLIDRLVREMEREPAIEMITAAHRFEKAAEVQSPHQVKVVLSATGDALYFSRASIPFRADGSHGSDTTYLSAPGHLRIHARSAPALRALEAVAAGAGGDARAIARLGEWGKNPGARDEGRFAGSGHAGGCGSG